MLAFHTRLVSPMRPTGRIHRFNPGRLAVTRALLAAALPTPGQADPLEPMAFAPLGTLTLGAGQYLIDTSGRRTHAAKRRPPDALHRCAV